MALLRESSSCRRRWVCLVHGGDTVRFPLRAHQSGSNPRSAHSSVAAGKRPGFTLAQTGKAELQPRRRGGSLNPRVAWHGFAGCAAALGAGGNQSLQLEPGTNLHPSSFVNERASRIRLATKLKSAAACAGSFPFSVSSPGEKLAFCLEGCCDGCRKTRENEECARAARCRK
ncbi:uncharacterized protein B0H64DRAFT_20136 [Chaetomium fimeti]|uniref:Uncharacterized protein n=1 Tax=Chaetomium fimeti TaxID=1854472 RepID=A0AAE0HQ20_9PEZI|nr:hypothetical protein B0H64DRAFT_20136 [Chaetomium fimeti]